MEENAENRIEVEGVPDKDPETIGEALKKYYEEQLSQAEGGGIKMVTLTPRMAELEKVMTQHCLSFN